MGHKEMMTQSKSKTKKKKTKQLMTRQRQMALRDSTSGLSSQKWANVGPKRRRRQPEDYEGLYYDNMQGSDYYKYFRSVADPFRGSAHVPLYDAFPSVPVTFRAGFPLTTDATYGNTGVVVCADTGQYLTASVGTATTVAWSANNLVGLSSVPDASSLRFVSACVKLSYVGNTTETAGYIRAFTVSDAVTVSTMPNTVDGGYSRSQSAYLPIGPDYAWTIQGYDNRCEEYRTKNGGTVTLEGIPCFGFMVHAPRYKAVECYRVSIVCNYECIPQTSSNNIGFLNDVVQSEEGEKTSLDPGLLENVRNLFGGLEGLREMYDDSPVLQSAIKWAGRTAATAMSGTAGVSVPSIHWSDLD
jgi:hypothetical protein